MRHHPWPWPSRAIAVPQQLQSQALNRSIGHRFPTVFLLPLLLALAGGWLARAFTRGLTPAPGSKL